MTMKHIFIWRQLTRLLPIKSIINYVKEDVGREEYYSRSVKTVPLYKIGYKHTGKIIGKPSNTDNSLQEKIDHPKKESNPCCFPMYVKCYQTIF
jgi:hypothetical protein